jgi:hypothetical protein
MSQGHSITAGGWLGGQFFWIKTSRGQSVGGQIVKAPWVQGWGHMRELESDRASWVQVRNERNHWTLWVLGQGI